MCIFLAIEGTMQENSHVRYNLQSLIHYFQDDTSSVGSNSTTDNNSRCTTPTDRVRGKRLKGRKKVVKVPMKNQYKFS